VQLALRIVFNLAIPLLVAVFILIARHERQ
jgi:hypothetical protein